MKPPRCPGEKWKRSTSPRPSPWGRGWGCYGLSSAVFGWLQRIIDGPGDRGGPLSKKSNADHPIPHTPTLYVNTLYLTDKRVNKSSHPVFMGKWERSTNGTLKMNDRGRPIPLTPWSY